ncbi:MAG: hypothetical protein CL947_02590 [Epsilonproteobacteria bacterium]|nr:hypothetical protein [Campylobacterota bacterium]|tara:strand:+ start:5004 stop:5432 length:429 start_codon:yes stop_codon:yes gene_type:complete
MKTSVKYIIVVACFINSQVQSNYDVQDNFKKVLEFIQSTNSSEFITVATDRHGKHFTGRSGSKVSYRYSTPSLSERIVISENAQPYHFVSTPFNTFLAILHQELSLKQQLEIPLLSSIWQFRYVQHAFESDKKQIVGVRFKN